MSLSVLKACGEILRPRRQVLHAIESALRVVIAVAVDLRPPLTKVSPRSGVDRRQQAVVRVGIEVAREVKKASQRTRQRY